jgi:hypothetical protein
MSVGAGIAFYTDALRQPGESAVRDELSEAVGAATIKAAPPMAVVGASVAGWGVQEWMYAATTVYVIAQLGYLLWKWRREAKKK